MTKLNIQKPINKRHIIQYTIVDYVNAFHQIHNNNTDLVNSDDIEFAKQLKSINKKITNKGLPSLQQDEDACVVDALIIDEPKFITGTRTTKDGKFILPVFTSSVGKIYKATIHYMLKRLGRVNNNQIEIHANYAVSMPKRIKRCKVILQHK